MRLSNVQVDIMTEEESAPPGGGSNADDGLKIDIFLDREVYFPGDTITGKVKLHNAAEREMRGIKLTLSCNVNVKFSGGKKAGEQFNEITYLHKETYIMGEGHQTVLPAGYHELTFSEPLVAKGNKDLPSSMEFPHGCSRYQVKVELDWPWSYCQEAVKTVNVVNICNLVDHPESNQPASFTNQHRPGGIFSCFGSSVIVIAGRLEKIAYVGGEHLLLNAEINNVSKVNIKDTVARINQIVTYESTGKISTTSERIIFEVRKGPVEAGKDLNIDEESLIIPPVPQSATLPCDFMRVSYQVEIGVSLDNNEQTWDMMAKQPIFIGTLPTKNAYKRFHPSMARPLPHIAEWPIDIKGLPAPQFEGAIVERNDIHGGVEQNFVMKYPVIAFDIEETMKHLESEDESEAEQAASDFSL